MRRRSALVVGIVAAVAALLLLRVRRDREAPSALDAGRDAPTPAGTAPTLATRRIPTAPRGRTAEIRTDADAIAEAPDDAKAPARAVSLRVVLVDAASGEPVEGRWIPLSIAARERARAMLENLTRSPDTPEKDGSLASGDTAGVIAGAEGLRYTVALRLPAGRCRWSPSEVVEGALAAGVTEVRYVVPVYRAIPLRLTVRGPDGRLAQGAEVAAVTVGGRRSSGRGSATARGEIELPVPFLPGEETRVALNWSPDPDHSLAVGTLSPEEGISDPEWKGPVPESPWDVWTAEVQLKGPCGHLDDNTETDFDLPTEESFGVAEGEPTRSVTVRALDREGAPVTGAKLSFMNFEARTGAAGTAVFDKVPPGTCWFTMAAPGRLSCTVETNVPPDGECVVDLREPTGASLEVVVVGEDDRPRAFAEVTPATPFFDTTGAVQRLDPYTDALGRRTFSRVQPGTAVVRASWAGHTGHATVTLVDGERTRVRIVVK